MALTTRKRLLTLLPTVQWLGDGESFKSRYLFQGDVPIVVWYSPPDPYRAISSILYLVPLSSNAIQVPVR